VPLCLSFTKGGFQSDQSGRNERHGSVQAAISRFSSAGNRLAESGARVSFRPCVISNRPSACSASGRAVQTLDPSPAIDVRLAELLRGSRRGMCVRRMDASDAAAGSLAAKRLLEARIVHRVLPLCFATATANQYVQSRAAGHRVEVAVRRWRDVGLVAGEREQRACLTTEIEHVAMHDEIAPPVGTLMESPPSVYLDLGMPRSGCRNSRADTRVVARQKSCGPPCEPCATALPPSLCGCGNTRPARNCPAVDDAPTDRSFPHRDSAGKCESFGLGSRARKVNIGMKRVRNNACRAQLPM